MIYPCIKKQSKTESKSDFWLGYNWQKTKTKKSLDF